MEEKLFTLSDMRPAFIAGENFENNLLNFNIGAIDDVTEPDFGDWMFNNFNITV